MASPQILMKNWIMKWNDIVKMKKESKWYMYIIPCKGIMNIRVPAHHIYSTNSVNTDEILQLPVHGPI